MEKQSLLTLIIAAAAASAVAAVLDRFAPRRGRGWLAAAVALVAGVLAGSRVALEKWPQAAPGQAAEWLPHVAIAVAVMLLATCWMAARWWWLRAGLAAVAGAAVAGAGGLGRIIGRIEDPATRWEWWVGIGAASLLLGLSAAAVYRHVQRRATGSGPPGGLGARLRDEHWATLALGLAIGAGALAILFSAESAKLMQLGLALAGAWLGVAITGLIFRPRLGMAGAAVITAVCYAWLWFTAYFTGAEPHALATALALSAAGASAIGAFGPLARRGGWVRLVVVAVVALALAGAAAALHGPAYLSRLKDMGQMGE